MTVEQVMENLTVRVSGADKASSKLDDYSSGRTAIWKVTIQKLNMLGHPSRDHIVTDRNGDVGNNTHNTVLQCAYDNGILSGVVYLIMIILAGVMALRAALMKQHAAAWYTIIVVIHAGYCITAMLASITLPFLYLITLLYYLTYAPIFDREFLNET